MKIFDRVAYLEEYDYKMQKFVSIRNKKAFLLDEIPSYYPGTSKYRNFWKDQHKKCVEGYWAIDDPTITEDTHTNEDAWRWMPPNLYFYANFGTILHQQYKGAPRSKITPYLRDVEWEFFYNFATCRGFSGFEGDLTHSCDIRLKADSIPSKKEAPELYTKDGSLKEYVPVHDYIRALHSYNKGKALYNNPMKNLFLMGCRGFGKSYMVGVGLMLHTFLFDFMIEYDLSAKPSVEIGVGAALSDKSAELITKMMEAFYSLPGEYEDKVSGKKYRAPFYKNTSGKISKPNTKMVHSYQKKVGNLWVEAGTGTKIEHRVFTKENPDAMAGLRPALIIIEEVGLLENVKDVHGSNEAAQKIDQKLGISVYIGTGGNVDKVAECESIFREPAAFDMLEFEDPYEGSATSTCWFMPYHYARNIHKDENGNTDLLRAHKDIMNERKKKMGKKNASSIIDRHLMNFPIVPSEMFLSMKGNRFPVTELRKQLNNVKRNNYYLSNSTNVTLSFDTDSPTGVTYHIDHENKLKPLHEYQRRKDDYDDPQGCVVIYEFPKEVDGKIPDDMYVIGYDPYVSKDQSSGSSLGAVYVFKNNNYAASNYGYSQIVAEYVGKPYEGLDHFNENVLKLSMMYGSTPRGIYFENNKGAAVYEYFHKQKKLGLLATKPKHILTSKTRSPTRFIEYGFSVPNPTIKDRILEYIYDWLIEERGVYEGETIRNLDLIPSRGLLEELIAWNPDDNFDRVSGFAGCIIALEDDKTRSVYQKKQNSKVNPLAFLADNDRMFKNNNNYVPFERV